MRKLKWFSAAMLLSAAGLTMAQPRPAMPVSLRGQLTAAEVQLDRKPEETLMDIQANLLKYPSNELSTALYIKGKAQSLLAAKADGDARVRQLRQAALDMVRRGLLGP